MGRFTIPLDGSPYGKLESALEPDEHGRGMDMCSINPTKLGKKYRYAYACGAQRPCHFPNTLTKVNFQFWWWLWRWWWWCAEVHLCMIWQLDLVKKKAKNWHEAGAVPSEPFFVARPGATEEDDGELLIVFFQMDFQQNYW